MHPFIIVAMVVAWLIAFHWTRITLTALRKLPRVPDLLDPRYDPSPDPPANTDLPAVTVIVPARNEAVSLEATLRSLL
ncbi:MAG: family 2 glycosyl transferase, partial [Acidobacteriaceae bacterium]